MIPLRWLTPLLFSGEGEGFSRGPIRLPACFPRSAFKRLFLVVGEKIPFEAINAVSKYLKDNKIHRNGVYIAHDSMGYARYIGRGGIFNRLTSCRDSHRLEVKYFSFYVVDRGSTKEN
jgi:hypothetical protein